MRSFIRLSCTLSFVVAASAQIGSTTGSSAVSTSGVLGGVIGGAPTAVSVVSNSPYFASSSGPEMPGGVVTGAPYSAEQVTEHVQTLVDGTHITQPAQTTKLYRDSAGRTRTERSFPLPPGVLGNVADVPSFIEISDPVAGVRYTLEPHNQTARRMTMRSAGTPAPPSAPVPATNGAFLPKMIQLQPAFRQAQPGSAPQVQTPRPEFSRESLGTQTIEGVQAEGLRTTVTYPVGAVGNDRPLITMSETWTSRELKMVVLTKNSDPRTGDSTTRLTNISRTEPDAFMFEVPADYKIVEPETAVRN